MIIIGQREYIFFDSSSRGLKNEIQYRGVSGYLKLGGQVVMRRLMRHAAAAGGAFYSAKMWGVIAPPPVTPLQ